MAVLEGQSQSDFTKGPIEYASGPLKGLQKKHFFQASFIFANLLAESARDGAATIYRKLAEKHGRRNVNGRVLTEEDVALICEAYVDDALRRRSKRRESSRDGGLTGEHLIFAKAERGNLYLYAAYHGEPMDRIVEAIRVCGEDFPELREIVPGVFNSQV